MAQVTVNINGKTYRMACDDGQEAHLSGLADRLNSSIEQLRDRFGEIGDQRLTVMAAITFADQFAEAAERLKRIESKIADLEAAQAAGDESREVAESAMAEAVGAVVDRVEVIAERLSGSGQNEDDGG